MDFLPAVFLGQKNPGYCPDSNLPMIMHFGLQQVNVGRPNPLTLTLFAYKKINMDVIKMQFWQYLGPSRVDIY